MLKTLLGRQLDRFERTWSYDASYLRRLLAANPVSVLKFGLVSGMAPRDGAPLGAVAAAEIAAARAQSSAPVSARVARQNGEALASHAAANAGPSPASASTAPAAPPSPGAKRRFKERLEMFNAPASSSRVEYRTVH